MSSSATSPWGAFVYWCKRKINRFFEWTLRSTDWEVWLGHNGLFITNESHVPRTSQTIWTVKDGERTIDGIELQPGDRVTVVHGPDGARVEKNSWRNFKLTQIQLTLRWFLNVREFAALVTFQDDAEETFNLTLAIPFMVKLFVSIDISGYSWPRWLCVPNGNALSGLQVDGQGARLFVKDNDWTTDYVKKSVYQFDWSDIHGTPQVDTMVVWQGRVEFEMPASAKFPASRHQMDIMRIRYVKIWPVFWKADQTTYVTQIRVDEPPRCHEKAVYGCSLPGVKTAEEAVDAYIEMMAANR